MVSKKVSILLWILSLVLTLMIAVYQRMTGPTHPVKGTEELKEKSVRYRLLRSYYEFEGLPVTITAPDRDVEATLHFRRYKAGDPWTPIPMRRERDALKAEVPGQPPAGKVEYKIDLSIDGEQVPLNKGKVLVARFKGRVPMFILITHVLFMFVGIWLALRTAMETLRKEGRYYRLVNWTLGVIVIGGMILGPIVQKYAFGDLWTGFPFGMDLTDNKTLLAGVFWVLAFFLKKRSKWWVLLAALAMVVVYLIPHSVMGSELDYKTGKMRNKYSDGIHRLYPREQLPDRYRFRV
jgi:hypothetical protein